MVLKQTNSLLSVFCIVVLYVLFTVDGFEVCAKSLELGANLQMNSSGEENQDDDTSTYSQRYSLHWDPMVTRRIQLGADVDYSNRWSTGTGGTEVISPSMRLNITNDIFGYMLNGLINNSYNSDKADLHDRYWDMELASTWMYELWPQLTARGGQRISEILEDVETTSTEEDWGEFSALWEYSKIRAYYNYFQSVDTSEQRQYESKNTRHMGRLEYFDQFWNDRIMLNFSQLAQKSDNEFKALATDGSALVKIDVSRAQAGEDPTPETGSLPSAPRLIDGNTNSGVIVIQYNRFVNLAVQTNLLPVNTVYVYTSRDDRLLTADTAAVTWDVYSSTDGMLWDRQIVGAGARFNRDEFRFEIDHKDQFLKRLGWCRVAVARRPSVGTTGRTRGRWAPGRSAR